MTTTHIALAVIFGWLLGQLSRTTYPSIRRWRLERRAKAIFFEFKRLKAEEGQQTYTCAGCGCTVESVGIPAKWLSRPSQNTFCCSRQCLEDETRAWAKRVVGDHFAKRKSS
jgi:hypothetical protein